MSKAKYPTKPTIIMDTREKPANRLFEPSEVGDKDVAAYVVEKVDAGDYTVADIPNLVVVEKKQDGKELYGNLILKRDVFMRCIERMREFKHKYIIIQQTLDEFYDHRNWKHIARIVSRRFGAMSAVESWMIKLHQDENIHFIFAGKHAARWTKRVLCKTYEWERKRLGRLKKDRK